MANLNLSRAHFAATMLALLQLGSAFAAPSIPSETRTSTYPVPANFCFYPGEWNGDLAKATLRFRMVIPPESQLRHGDIFVGFRQPSAPGRLWLYGFTLNSTGFGSAPDWVQYDASRVPPVYAMGQLLDPISSIDVFPAAMDLRRFDGDGEILVGYGFRANFSGSTPADSYKDMVDNLRYASIFRIDKAAPLRFGNWTCIKFTELTQRFEGALPGN